MTRFQSDCVKCPCSVFAVALRFTSVHFNDDEEEGEDEDEDDSKSNR